MIDLDNDSNNQIICFNVTHLFKRGKTLFI